jgi:cobalt-precorrin 5A hydrolase/precorrin-3B C17-methyltransferase
MERAELALSEARAGGSVALVSGGDVGVYAMASPVLEIAGDDVEVMVVPGVTAAQAAASLLGSPLGHDHCSISLSDLLTPWEVIQGRVEAAAEGDFVLSLYNPRSKARDWQLGKVKEILMQHRPPDTPVGLVRDAYRPTQRVTLTDLASLRPESVDMLTIVVVGSSRTRVVAGRMVTPRGYLT